MLALGDAEEYGKMMEEMYDEYNEYTTSRCESMHHFLEKMNDKFIKNNNNNIKSVKIPKIFFDEINESKCKYLHELYSKFISLFNKDAINYV
jgi:hypothetical protein